MARIRLALAQVDPTVGDLEGNGALVRSWTAQAAKAGADLVAFPEMMLTGYPVEDLVFRESFGAASRARLERLAGELASDRLGELPVVVGYLDADGPTRPGAQAHPGRGARNALALLHRGQVVARYFKHHLPNYGVFDEDRYFVPGQVLTVAGIAGANVAFTICEDLWQDGGPFAVARSAGVDLVININGSPYERNKDDVRLPLVARRAAEAGATVAYVNMIGGQDELVFDGDSMIVAPDGTLLARAPQFVETLLVADLDLPAPPALRAPAPPAPPVLSLPADTNRTIGESAVLAQDPQVENPPILNAQMRVERVGTITGPALAAPTANAPAPLAPRLSDPAEVWHALVLGVGDYVRKNGFRSVILGLSGGIDSALVATLAADAIGAAAVTAVAMPSKYSSDHSVSDAEDLARRLGLDYRVQPIADLVATYLQQLPLTGLAEENLQARVRGVILMGLSNQEGHLVLATGNKSEYAVGYSTLYGDSVGGFAPIKDVPKMLVYELARWRNGAATERGEQPPIPEHILVKPPSAELRPDQQDSDSLPPYDVLDPILAGYIDNDLGRAELVATGFEAATVDRVIRLVDGAEYKRRQTAPGPKISIKAFGRDRRLPITNRFREP